MQKFKGIDWLKIDIANSYGLDKENYNIRISWVNNNIDNLESLVEKADKPVQFLSGVKALRNYQNHLPSGHPISLDCCSSGSQILSVCGNDINGMRITNVLNTGNRLDAYKVIYERFKELINDPNTSISRKDIKQAIMTSLYLSTATPKKVIGEKNLPYFKQAIAELMPSVQEISDIFLQLWDSSKYANEWVMPDLFHAVLPSEDTIENEYNIKNINFIVSKKVNIPLKYSKQLGAGIIHSIDSFIAREACMFALLDNNTRNKIKTLVGINHLSSTYEEPKFTIINHDDIDNPFSFIHEVEFEYNGVKYNSVASAYLSCEYDTYISHEEAIKVLNNTSTLSLTRVPYWDFNKLNVLKQILLARFNTEPEILDQLQDYTKYICNDYYWGVNKNNIGLNHYGKLLIEINDIISKVNYADRMVKKLWIAYQETGYLSVRILKYLNQYNIKYVDFNKIKQLVSVLPKEKFDIFCIHDSFHVLPNHANELRLIINFIYANLYMSHLLEYILFSITGDTYDQVKDPEIYNLIMDSDYIIC